MLIIGHRGAPAHAPENTLRSFRTALAMGCNALEFDVQQCASGEMVVIHDRELSRTTSGSGAVAAHDATTLKKLNAGEGETIPLLSEVLEEFKNKAVLFIEIKSKTEAAAQRLVEEIRAAVKAGWQQEKLIVISFHPKILGWVRALAPEIPLGLDYEEKTLRELKPAIAELKPEYLNPWIEIADEGAMAFAKKNDMKVAVWTLQNRLEVQKALKLGVDGMMADDPKLIA